MYRKVIFGFCFVVAIAVLWCLYENGDFHPEIIVNLINDHPINAVFIFIFIYAVAMIAMLPSLPINLAAGFLWGGIEGGCISSLAATFGGWIAFLIARNILGQHVAAKLKKKWFNALRAELEQNGLKYLALARINPVVPTGLLNYLCGVTRLRGIDFLWITFICSLPGSIAVAYVGDIFQNFTTARAKVEDIFSGMIIIFALFTFIFCIKFTMKITKAMKDIDEKHPADHDIE